MFCATPSDSSSSASSSSTGSWVEVERASWSPQPVFRVLADMGGMDLTETEGTGNLGIGMIAVVADHAGFEQGATGVNGGAVRLVGAYQR